MLLPAADASPADWVVERWGEFGELVPRGFEACARVFHPATLEGRPVAWSDIADRMGTTAHPRMELSGLMRRRDFDWSPLPGVFDGVPSQDCIPEEILPAVAGVLRRATATPDRCLFAIWDGYGGWPDALRAAPHVSLPGRGYYLFDGTIDDADGIRVGAPVECRFGPALWWPEDRAWFVGSDTDLMTSYVAGPQALVDDLLAEPGLEAFAVPPATGFDQRGDDVNPMID